MKKHLFRFRNALIVGFGILGFQSAMAGVSMVQATSDLNNAYYQFNFTNSPKFLRLYLDMDKVQSTGYRAHGVGADFLIENSHLYRYSGSNGAWGWTLLKSIPMNRTSNLVKWTVARVDLRSPASLNYVAQMDSPSSISSVLSQIMYVAPSVSLSVDGAPNLPFNGTSTKVTVGFVSGTPTKVELSRDGNSPFAIWPSDTFFTLAADGKSLSGNWCITSSCWGGVAGPHVLNVVATYANGSTAKASVSLNVVAEPVPQPSPTPQPAPAPSPTATPFPIPSNQVKLSDFGGIPNASSSVIINAFNQAFSRLKTLGGGTLFIEPGVYNFGNYASGSIVSVSGLRNVLVSAYGAQFRVNSTSTSTVYFFLMNNPHNVTMKGMSFYDSGADMSIKGKGAHCFEIVTSTPTAGFKTVDVTADHVGRFIGSSMQSSGQYTFEGFDIHGTVKNTYYGVGMMFNGSNSKVNITAMNVRRAFIGYGLKNWDIVVKGSADGAALGSNGFVELAADGRGNVENVKINLDITGNLRNYRGMITLYQQAQATVKAYHRNIKAHATVRSLTGVPTTVFFFPAEIPGITAYQPTTISTWENVELTSTLIGSYAGKWIDTPSISSGTTNSVLVDTDLARLLNISLLPRYFRVVDLPNPL